VTEERVLVVDDEVVLCQSVEKILKRKGRFPKDRKVNVIAIAGDGSAGDIGMACLSGAAERNDDGIFFCFDNEAYMNTGIQRSGCTPELSWTTSTLEGKQERKKDLPQIMAAHHIPYVATASIGFPEDFIQKMIKARDIPTAEASKLFETIYRDVNIAVANELALFCEEAGIDYFEAAKAANSQPYSHLLLPGVAWEGTASQFMPHLLAAETEKSSLGSLTFLTFRAM
jgi:hypothetical protein